MPPTCPHGYPPQSCLICQTLGGRQSPPAGTATEDRPRRRGGRPGRQGEVTTVAAGAPVRSWTPSLLGIVVAVLAGLVLLWFVAGVVWAVLRLVELLAAVVVAGWAGYRLGVRHGRRTR